jgi:tRNA(fMet)-specific endonuclease VapC
MSLLERGGAEGFTIRTRLYQVPLDDIGTTIISYEEQMRGWLAETARASASEDQAKAYSRLKRELRNYCDIPVFDYESTAIQVFNRLRNLRIRIGTMDLKIASIALANNAVLLTRNLNDFNKVPNLRAEDWSL